MANIISIVSGKGGSGKSSLAINVASYLHRTGVKVGLVDADIGQHSIWVWAGFRKKGSSIIDLPVFKMDKPHDLLKIQDEESDLDVLVVDTGGHGHSSNDAARAAILNSNYVLVPCQPSLFDLMASKETVEVAQGAGVPCAYVLTRCDLRSRLHVEVQDWLEEQKLPVLKAVVGESIDYKRLLPEGECVVSKSMYSVPSLQITAICKELFV